MLLLFVRPAEDIASKEPASTPCTLPSSSFCEFVYAVDNEFAATEIESATQENIGCDTATRPPPGDVVVKRSSDL